MIGDSAECVAACEPGFRDTFKSLAAVTPDGMHLQVAIVISQRWSLEPLVGQRCEYLCPAEEVLTQAAACGDVAFHATLRHGAFNRWRRTGLEHLKDDG